MKIDIQAYIRDIPNFPKEGILFKDISPLLASGEVLNYTINQMAAECNEADIIIGPDARGFLFGTPIAAQLKKPFVMVRKPGKLPGEVVSIDYGKEYGQDRLEIQTGFIKSGQKAVIVDDVLATGGTLNAIIELLKSQGVEVIKVIMLMELTELKGREKINDKNIQIVSLVQV